MYSVEEARDRILGHIRPLAAIDLPLGEVFGCVLAEDVKTGIELPPFASSAMDGFAVRSSDIASATAAMPVTLPVVGRAMIGHRPKDVVGENEAVAIATGAPIPAGADCIVPVELTISPGGAQDRVEILESVPAGRHVRPAGEDSHMGDVLVPAGRRLGAPELGLVAAAGHSHVPVYPRPRVAVISTGDELVEPGKTLDYGQIHDSNAVTIAAQVKEAGAQPFHVGIVKDDVARLREEVLAHVASADAFISSGGVSVGERDVVKAAFAAEGNVDFYKVAMQPGMPQGFGIVEGRPFFGLPGNPVSVFVSIKLESQTPQTMNDRLPPPCLPRPVAYARAQSRVYMVHVLRDQSPRQHSRSSHSH
jgi:molybdopterin molybdotransferase